MHGHGHGIETLLFLSVFYFFLSTFKFSEISDWSCVVGEERGLRNPVNLSWSAMGMVVVDKCHYYDQSKSFGLKREGTLYKIKCYSLSLSL